VAVGRPLYHNWDEMLSTTPFVMALAYAVLRVRLFEPTQAALDMALRSTSESIAVLDPDGQVIYANRQAAALGLERERHLSDGLRAIGAAPEAIASLAASYATTNSRWARTLTFGAPARFLEVTTEPVVDGRGTMLGTLFMGRDVTERERHHERLDFERARLAEAVQQLSHMASHDALTNLPNRRSLEERLEQAIFDAGRGRAGSLLFLDLDNFKLVNDTLGHAAGDRLLVELTQLLGQQLRAGDVLARLGGDEFAIILGDTDTEQGRRIAERLRAAVEAFRFRTDGRSFELGLSIGLTAIDGGQQAQVLLAQADIAMYAAKEQGRNRVALYQPAGAPAASEPQPAPAKC
jgi:diguanylate cyclase (GGDEF)-like protein